ncbi:HYDIN protein, partial [Heliornis fulica]|nr:HYDIN protein [Heliornis fulica]
VRVSAKAVFSKYSIHPASGITFGTLMSGTRKTCSFQLENKGVIGFKFSICRADQDASWLEAREQQSSCWGCLRWAFGHQPLLGLSPQACLTVGMFTVSPVFGSIPSGGQQMVTVDCHAKSPGQCKENLSIDITDR